MATVLVHVHLRDGPVGLWRVLTNPERIAQFYGPKVRQVWVDRGNDAVPTKGDGATWEEHFDSLVRQSPYLDRYETFEADESESLEAVFERLLAERGMAALKSLPQKSLVSRG